MPTSSTTELLPMDAPTIEAGTTGLAGTAGGPAPDSAAPPPPAPWGEPVPGAPPGRPWLRAPGLTPYPASLSAMAARAAAIRAGTAPELVWLVEHPPLYTAGTSARPDDLADPGRFPTFDAGRGGQWTYHGPGQRTAYVVLDLQDPHGPVPARDVRRYVHGLEGWLIGALRRLGVRGERREGRVGIWVAHDGRESKIARHRGAGDALGELARGGAQRRTRRWTTSAASCPAASASTA